MLWFEPSDHACSDVGRHSDLSAVTGSCEADALQRHVTPLKLGFEVMQIVPQRGPRPRPTEN